MIKRLLVANRSEIAVRIMATASVLGIETVAVYAADDAACGHVSRADAALELPGVAGGRRIGLLFHRQRGPGRGL
jgi:acetyl/propionyl-CoA carboxylase alpha subunit